MKSKACNFWRISKISTGITLILSTAVLAANAQSYPQGFSQILVAKGISGPTNMAFAPDGRIFICEQTGKLRVIKNGNLLKRSFITLSVDARGERGLLGVAFDPDFVNNNWVYIYYTRSGGSNNRVIRVKANGDTAVKSTMQTLLDFDTLTNSVHGNGGSLKFGTDGKLYIAVGYNQRDSKSQSLNTYLGKLLRVNPDGTAPPDNPYTTGNEPKKRIWCYGLKNPFTIDIEPVTGKIFVNDVGEHTWEEINDATTSKKNFGWPNAEGNSEDPKFTDPVYTYNHSGNTDQTGCAITGGAFLPSNTTNYPVKYKDNYFFIDLCGRWINRITYMDSVVRNTFATNLPGGNVALTTGIDGNLYFLSRDSGALYKIIYSSNIVSENNKTRGETQVVSLSPDSSKKLWLYPSPANESVTIESTGFNTTNNFIKIYDEKGMLIKSLKITGTKTIINTSTFAKGFYYIIIINDEVTVKKEKIEITH